MGLAWLLTACQSSADEKPPNIVIIFLDDSGWGDFVPFGGKLETPELCRLAGEGCSFTNFYVPQAICSASREDQKNLTRWYTEHAVDFIRRHRDGSA